MAKVDLRMQFNDQCFLIENSGIPHKAVTKGRETKPAPDPPPENKPANDEGKEDIPDTNPPGTPAKPDPTDPTGGGTPGKDGPEPEVEAPGQGGTKPASETKAEQEVQRPPKPAVKDRFVVYTGVDVKPEHCTNTDTDGKSGIDPAGLFQNYFDTYFAANEKRGINKAPPADFAIFKSYGAKKQKGKQVDVKLPLNSEFQDLTYDDTMSGIGKGASGADYSDISGMLSTHLGSAQVTNFSITFSGKDPDHATKIVEVDLDIEVDSLQALMRRVRRKGTDGETYLVSISDLIRLPSETEEVNTGQGGDAWKALRTNLDKRLQGTEATTADIKNAIGYHGLSDKAIDSLVKSYNDSKKPVNVSGVGAFFPGLHQAVADETFKGGDITSGELERFFAAKRMQGQMNRPSSNCPIANSSANRKKVENPDFYQIKVEWGYTEDANGVPIWGNTSAMQALRSALYLTLVSYEIDYTAEGAIVLKLKYVGRTQNILDSTQANVLKLTKEEENILGAMRDMKNIFKGLSTETKAGDFDNVSTKSKQAAILIAKIPGITAAKGDKNASMQHTLLAPLWVNQPGATSDTLLANPFQDKGKELTDKYWSEKASFMANAIDHFLTYSRTRRYGQLYNLLMKEQRIYVVDVPYNYLGFDEGLMDLIANAGSDVGKCVEGVKHEGLEHGWVSSAEQPIPSDLVQDKSKLTAEEQKFLELAYEYQKSEAGTVGAGVWAGMREKTKKLEQKMASYVPQKQVAKGSEECKVAEEKQAELGPLVAKALADNKLRKSVAGVESKDKDGNTIPTGAVPTPVTTVDASNQKAGTADKKSAEDLLASVRVVKGPESHSFDQTVLGQQAQKDQEKAQDAANKVGGKGDDKKDENVSKVPTPDEKANESSAGTGQTSVGVGGVDYVQSNVKTGENKSGKNRKVYFTTIGHVLECVCNIADFKGADGKIADGIDLRIVLGPLQTHGIYRQADPESVEEVNFPIQNIGDIPIAMTLLDQYMIKNVIKRGREVYTLNAFIKDFIKEFLSTALGKECNVHNGARTERITIDYIQSKLKFTDSLQEYAYGGLVAGLGNLFGGLNLGGGLQHPTLPGQPPKKEGTQLLTGKAAWPASWKREMGRPEIQKLFKEARLVGSNSASGITTYIIVRAESFALEYLNPSDLFGKNPKVKMPIMTPPKRVDNASGKMRKLKFKRSEAPFVREARLTGDSNLHGGLLRDIYDCDVEILGMPIFRPGTVIYIDPVMHVGRFTDDPLITLSMVNNTLGMGGFYTIIKTRHNLINNKEAIYTTEIEAIWNSFGGCKPLPVTPAQQTALAKAKLSSNKAIVDGVKKEAEAQAKADADAAARAAARRAYQPGMKL